MVLGWSRSSESPAAPAAPAAGEVGVTKVDRIDPPFPGNASLLPPQGDGGAEDDDIDRKAGWFIERKRKELSDGYKAAGPAPRPPWSWRSDTVGISESGRKMSGKTAWPEVVGLPSDAATAMIEDDRPDVQVVVLPTASFVTTDFNSNRVRVFVDKLGNVARVPKIG
ncbi:hypothetical protein ACP4OV_016478 [Aristida adscensionis]